MNHSANKVQEVLSSIRSGGGSVPGEDYVDIRLAGLWMHTNELENAERERQLKDRLRAVAIEYD
jgi:hypothetical protein